MPAAPAPSPSGDALDIASDASWAKVLRLAPDLAGADRPEAELVRTIKPNEYGREMVACLQANGFPDAELTLDGEGYSVEYADNASRQATVLAEYVCEVQYPIDPTYTQPLRTDQLEVLYDYYVGPLRQCLSEEGFETSDPQSKDTFIEAFQAGNNWDPLAETLASISSSDRIVEVQGACPAVPTGFYE